MSSIKVRTSLLSVLVLSSVLGLVSCADGPTYAEALKTMPPIPKGKGRVFVYRDTSFGAVWRPKINIDGQPIATSTANGFSYSDQAPGQHVVSLVTEWKHKDTVTVTANQPSFVSTHVTPGAFAAHVIPTFVSKLEGESAIQNCKLVTD